MRIFNLFELEKEIQVMDIGAAAIAEVPVYKILCEKMMAHLSYHKNILTMQLV